MINKEILQEVMSQHFKIREDYTYENIWDALDNYSDRILEQENESTDKRKWNEACAEQIEACSDFCRELLYNDADAETWPDKIMKTKKVEYPY